MYRWDREAVVVVISDCFFFMGVRNESINVVDTKTQHNVTHIYIVRYCTVLYCNVMTHLFLLIQNYNEQASSLFAKTARLLLNLAYP